MIELESYPANAQVEANEARGGLNIHLPDGVVSVSPEWHLGGFSVRFVRLPAGEALALGGGDQRTWVKVVTGETSEPARRPFPAVGEVRSTHAASATVRSAVDSVLCIVRDLAPAAIADMAGLEASGPQSERLQWQTFDEKFGAFTDVFRGRDAHMVPGFHLLDRAGIEIAYVHFWTTGKGVDVSTHNHGNDPSELSPAFAEVHLVLRNGTGSGGMYETSAPGAADRTRMIIGAGEEHGPFFRFDEASGKPKMLGNGAVEYPWHGWQGGKDGQPGRSYDLVAAFEINPEYVCVR